MLPTLATIAVVLIALAGVASAAKPESTPALVRFEPEKGTDLIADCGNFEVLTDFVVDGHSTIFFDSAGVPDYARAHLRFVDFYYNSETREGFTEHEHSNTLIDLPSGDEVTSSGVSYRVTVPGEGVVLLEAGRLERQSKRLIRSSAVPAVFEEAAGVRSAHRRQRRSHGFDQRFAGSGLSFSQDPLHLREGLLYRVHVRGVRRQVEQLASRPLDELAYPSPLVGGEIVHDDHLTGREARSQRLLDVGLEDRPRGCPLHRHGRSHAAVRHTGEQRDVLAPVLRGRGPQALAHPRPSVQRRERDVRAHLVHEHQAGGF